MRSNQNAERRSNRDPAGRRERGCSPGRRGAGRADAESRASEAERWARPWPAVREASRDKRRSAARSGARCAGSGAGAPRRRGLPASFTGRRRAGASCRRRGRERPRGGATRRVSPRRGGRAFPDTQPGSVSTRAARGAADGRLQAAGAEESAQRPRGHGPARGPHPAGRPAGRLPAPGRAEEH